MRRKRLLKESIKRGLAVFLAVAMVFGGTDMTAYARWFDLDQNGKLDYDDIFGSYDSYWMEGVDADLGESVVFDVEDDIWQMANYRIYRGDIDYSEDESEIYESGETIPLGNRPELLSYYWTKDQWDSGDPENTEELNSGSVCRIASVQEDDYDFYYTCHVKADGIDEELASFMYHINALPEDGEYRGWYSSDCYVPCGERATVTPDLTGLQRYNRASREWQDVTDYSRFSFEWYHWDSKTDKEIMVAQTKEYQTDPVTVNDRYTYIVYENGQQIGAATVYLEIAPDEGWHLDGYSETDIVEEVGAVAGEPVNFWLWDDHSEGVYYYDSVNKSRKFYSYDADLDDSGYELTIAWKRNDTGEEVSGYYLNYTPTQEEIDSHLEFVCEISLHTRDEEDGTEKETVLPITYRVKLVQGVREGTLCCELSTENYVVSGARGNSITLGLRYKTFKEYQYGWWYENGPDNYPGRIQYKWYRGDNQEDILSEEISMTLDSITEEDYGASYVCEVYCDGELSAVQTVVLKDPETAEYKVEAIKESYEVGATPGINSNLASYYNFHFYLQYEDGTREDTLCWQHPDHYSVRWYEISAPEVILSESEDLWFEDLKKEDFEKTFRCEVMVDGVVAAAADFRFRDDSKAALTVMNGWGYSSSADLGKTVTLDALNWCPLYIDNGEGTMEGVTAAGYKDRLQFSWYREDDPDHILSNTSKLTLDPVTADDYNTRYCIEITAINEGAENSTGISYVTLYDGSRELMHMEIPYAHIFAVPGETIAVQPKIVFKETGEEVTESEYQSYSYEWEGEGGYVYDRINRFLVNDPGEECDTLMQYSIYVNDDYGNWLNGSLEVRRFTDEVLEDDAFQWDEGTQMIAPTGEDYGLEIFTAQSPEYENYYIYREIPMLEGDEKETYDQERANTVDAQIRDLPNPAGTEDADLVEDARTAYESLTEDQIEYLGDRYGELEEILLRAEEQIEQAMQDAEDLPIANQVKEAIESLDPDSENYAEDVEWARERYDDLSPNQQRLVGEDTYNKLLAAEEQVALAEEAEDQRIADEVKAMIEALEDTSADYERDVNKARKAFENLTWKQLELLGDEEVTALEEQLAAAESRLAEIKAVNDPVRAAEVEAQINALTPGEDSKYDAAAVQAARAAFKALTNDQKALVSPEALDKLHEAESQIEEAAGEVNQNAADEVADMIEALNADDENAVAAAQAAYENLTKAQKRLIASELKQKLEAAVKKVEEARAAAEEAAKKAAEEAAKKAAAEEAAKKAAAEKAAAEKAAAEKAAAEAAKKAAEEAAKNKKVTSIKITSNASNKIAAGKKVKLTAEILPADAANKAVTWSSSNPKVAKVDAKGVVTVLKKTGGKKAVITAAAADGSGVKATFNITSMKGVVKKVKITGKKTVKAGKKLKLKAKVTATKKANKKIAWESSNTKYATVKNGKVTALKAGKGKTVKITARALDGSGKKASVKIKITK